MDPEAENAALVEGMLAAYAQGLFPMAEPGGPVRWYDPDPRGVFLLEEGGLRVSRSLRQRVRGPARGQNGSGVFEVTCDRAFGRVIRACAQPRGEDDGAWIDERIIGVYETLHAAGHAHSIEAWARPGGGDGDPELVGGLYGVHIGGLFAGESMFSRPERGGTDASKVCLVHLWHHLFWIGAVVLDTQFLTPHLESLGAVEVRRAAYRGLLGRALTGERAGLCWGAFDAGRAVRSVAGGGPAGRY